MVSQAVLTTHWITTVDSQTGRQDTKGRHQPGHLSPHRHNHCIPMCTGNPTVGHQWNSHTHSPATILGRGRKQPTSHYNHSTTLLEIYYCTTELTETLPHNWSDFIMCPPLKLKVRLGAREAPHSLFIRGQTAPLPDRM